MSLQTNASCAYNDKGVTVNSEMNASEKESSLTFTRSDNPRITNLAEKSPIVARANYLVIYQTNLYIMNIIINFSINY